MALLHLCSQTCKLRSHLTNYPLPRSSLPNLRLVGPAHLDSPNRYTIPYSSSLSICKSDQDAHRSGRRSQHQRATVDVRLVLTRISAQRGTAELLRGSARLGLGGLRVKVSTQLSSLASASGALHIKMRRVSLPSFSPSPPTPWTIISGFRLRDHYWPAQLRRRSEHIVTANVDALKRSVTPIHLQTSRYLRPPTRIPHCRPRRPG